MKRQLVMIGINCNNMFYLFGVCFCCCVVVTVAFVVLVGVVLTVGVGLATGGLVFLGGSRGGDDELLLDWPIFPADRSMDSDEERRGGGIGWG